MVQNEAAEIRSSAGNYNTCLVLCAKLKSEICISAETSPEIDKTTKLNIKKKIGVCRTRLGQQVYNPRMESDSCLLKIDVASARLLSSLRIAPQGKHVVLRRVGN